MKTSLYPMSEFIRLLHSYGFISLTPNTDKERRYFLLIDAYHEFLIAFQYFEETDGVQLLDNAIGMFHDAGFKYMFSPHVTFEKWYEEFQVMHDTLIEYIKSAVVKA